MKGAIFSISTLVLVVAFNTPTIVVADWDPVLEAREEAERNAARAAAAKREAEVKAMRREAELKVHRQYLGKDAIGKSDDEVSRLYKERTEKAQADALKQSAEGQAMFNDLMQRQEAHRDRTNQAMKSMTGKSVDDMMKMSDGELDAFAKEMEKKYGAE